MNQTAANLVDHVLPEVPVRQWVLTFPMRVRLARAWRPAVRREVAGAVLEVVAAWYREAVGDPGAEGGAVGFWQLAGSALNLNPHLHALVLDGAYRWDAGRERPVFRCASRPGREAMDRLVRKMRRAVEGVLARHGLGEDTEGDEEAGRLAEALGLPTTRWRNAGEREDRRRCHGFDAYFDLHAGVRVGGRDRSGQERLARYVTRPVLKLERLTELPDGRLVLALKRSWEDGTSEVVFRPLDLLKRLAALVPQARANLVVYRGVLAGHHRWRAAVVPPAGAEAPAGRRRSGWIPWAELMRRTFGISALVCRMCGTGLVVRAVVRSPEVARKLLQVLGLPCKPEEVEPRSYRGEPWEDADFW